VLTSDESRQRGWRLAWSCTYPDCDARGDLVTPRREDGMNIFELLGEAHKEAAEVSGA